jgi:hypothetical protein
MSKELRQPSLRVGYRRLQAERAVELGAVGLQPRVVLHLFTTSGRTNAVAFVCDSGAALTFVGLDAALSWGIPLPPPEAETTLELGTATGTQAVRVRPGRIRLWWNADRTGYPFDWPVLFRPGLPLSVPPLLGLGGVVATCDWLFTGQYHPDAPFGALTLDDLR